MLFYFKKYFLMDGEIMVLYVKNAKNTKKNLRTRLQSHLCGQIVNLNH